MSTALLQDAQPEGSAGLMPHIPEGIALESRPTRNAYLMT